MKRKIILAVVIVGLLAICHFLMKEWFVERLQEFWTMGPIYATWGNVSIWKDIDIVIGVTIFYILFSLVLISVVLLFKKESNGELELTVKLELFLGYIGIITGIVLCALYTNQYTQIIILSVCTVVGLTFGLLLSLREFSKNNKL